MRKNERESEAGRQLYFRKQGPKLINKTVKLIMFQGHRFQKNYFRVYPFSMLMFQYYCVKDQWRTFSIKRCPFPLFLPNVSFCCQDEKDINGLLEECRCGGKYQYIIQRTEREREREIDTKGPVFIRSLYNSFFIFEKLSFFHSPRRFFILIASSCSSLLPPRCKNPFFTIFDKSATNQPTDGQGLI